MTTATAWMRVAPASQRGYARRKMAPGRAKKVLLSIGAAVVAALLAPSVAGAGAASIDLLRGRPEYRIYGELMPDEPAWSAALERRSGVVVRRVAGCNVSSHFKTFTDTYNWTVGRFIPAIENH